VAQESQTYDEAVYIAAGYSYWQTGDFRINTEHPPLAKLLVAAPLLPLHLDLPLNSAAWQDADQYTFGANFLYHNRLSPDAILMVSRCITMALTLVFALILAKLSRCVSATWLYGGPEIAGPTWGWLRSQTPNARIGYSIYVYDFRKGSIRASPSR
ncbi:MAG: hypothetical protein WBX26_00675, partial [Candidatus Cybelea sp.]